MIKLKDILNESTWANRKFGEPLPTMADYQKAHNKETLNELMPSSGKPEEDDYLRDGKTFGKIFKIEKWKGVTQVWIKPTSGGWGKAVAGVAYDLKKLKDSGKRNVGRPIWVTK